MKVAYKNGRTKYEKEVESRVWNIRYSLHKSELTRRTIYVLMTMRGLM